jgi:hypothetical protein
VRVEVKELAQGACVVTALTPGRQSLGANGGGMQKLLDDPVDRKPDLTARVLGQVIGQTLTQAVQL